MSEIVQSLFIVVDEVYSVPGVGTVVSGIVNSGSIKSGDVLKLGPNSTGNFIDVTVKSLERKRIKIDKLNAGQSGTLALKKLKRHDVSNTFIYN